MASTTSTTLKLTIEKGPRIGETLEFNSRSTVRLGRVVRGNTLPIKDPGISSKHLTIEFDSGSGKWFVTDLDSSNGTFLNSSQIQPFSPFVINDGDEIKIGGFSSIRVLIVEIGDVGNIRRNPRRGGGKIGGDLGVGNGNCLNLGEEVRVRVLEGNDVELKKEDTKGRGRGRGRPKKVGVLEGDEHVKSLNLGEEVRVRVLEENEHGDDFREEIRVRVLDENDGVELEKDNKKGRGRGRGRPKKVVVLEEKNGESKGSDEENVKGKVEGGVSTRRMRSSRKEVEEFMSFNVLKPTRSTRSTKNVDEVALRKVKREKALDVEECTKAENVGAVENKSTKGGRGGKKKVNVKVELYGDEDVGLGDEPGRNLSGMERPEIIELRETSCEGNMVDGTLRNKIEDKVSSDVSVVGSREREGGSLCDIEFSCAQPNEEAVHKDESSLDREVPEQVECSLSAKDQPCVVPIDDTARHDESEENRNKDVLEVDVEVQREGALSISQQPCSEPLNKTGQQNELNEEADFQGAIENPSLEPIDESFSRDEGLVGPSHVEKESLDGLGCDFVIDEQVLRACDSLEIPEESDASYQGKDTGRDSVQVPDLEKMTLGEWFDYLEVYLPSQIYTATDEIIEEMRKRGKQFDEFMLMQQNEKGKLPLAA